MSELASRQVVETVPPAHVFPALPPGQSFQDLPSSDDDEDEDDGGDDSGPDADSDDDRRLQEMIDALEPFSEQEVDDMVHYLKERGLFAFVRKYVQELDIPLPRLLLAFGVLIPPEATAENQVRILKITLSRVLRQRERRQDLNSVDDVVDLIRKSKNIVLLTGAGVSTSCGIPDFRSPTGLYARLKEEHWELDDPQQMFDLSYFKEKPNVFYSFAKEIYPSNFIPSPCHRFVKMMEDQNRLLRNYTQNIDGLFESVGVERLLNCHGSFATASCLRCRTRFPGSAIEADVFASRVPLCPLCSGRDEEQAKLAPPARQPPAKWTASGKGFEDDPEDERPPVSEWEGKPLIKPDIVFFGEMLSDEFDRCLLHDREQVDLLIVIGTSLRVAPVSQLVSHLPHSVPQILINRDPVSHHNFDVVLLGDGDTVVKHLVHQLGPEWSLPVPRHFKNKPAQDLADETAVAMLEPERVADSHVWLYPGANRDHRWVQLVREAFEEDEDENDDQNLASADGETGIALDVESISDKPDQSVPASLDVPAPVVKPSSRPRSPEVESDEGHGKKIKMDDA
ncbi:NAD-dependent histone deacetylase sir2 [Microbotryomycetes sp. JL201]|nr:NAD-dependent histone deacetylase sir2 [Microbotryomycetes sp. JL201]